MGRRVGMTSNVASRKRHWKSKHRSFRNWKVLKGKLTYDQALATEKKYTAKRGIAGHGGGPRKRGRVYSVYSFNY